jgi:hypothetical protein
MPQPTGKKVVGTEALDRNKLSAGVRWQKGTTAVHDKASSWGVCFAMTGMWIREALCGLGPKTAAEQLGQHKQRICICQGVYETAWGRAGGKSKLLSPSEAVAVEKKVLAQFDLKVLGGAGSHNSQEELAATKKEMEDFSPTLQKIGMYMLISAVTDKYSHAVGVHLSPDQSGYYFDPNFGLYEYPDVQTAMSAFSTHFESTYGDVASGRMHMLVLD